MSQLNAIWPALISIMPEESVIDVVSGEHRSRYMVRGIGLIARSGRWQVSAIAGLAASLAAISSVETATQHRTIVFLCMLLITMSGFIWNDLHDVEMDRMAGKDRPIATGELSGKLAGTWTVVACILAILLSGAYFGRHAVLVLAGTIFFLLLYSPFARAHPLLKPTWVAALCMTPFAFGVVAVESDFDLRLIFLGFIYILAREVLIDLQDSQSDKEWGVQTLDSIYQVQTLKTISWLTILSSLSVGLFFVTGAISFTLLAVSIVSHILSLKSYLQDPQNGIITTRLGMLLAVLAISIGI